MKVLFVGGGNMASALIGGLLAKGYAAADLCALDPSDEARSRLASRHGVAVFASADQAPIEVADAVVMAVKPQQMREAASILAPRLGGQLVVTIAAGIRIADLSRWLGGRDRIVRVMPNTPALIGRGISGLYAPSWVDAGGRGAAEAILGAVGETVWCEHEVQLDAVTAVSGSGPAYVFYFLEALERAARELGFDETRSRRLAYSTFEGAVALARASAEAPATLRAQVTSKGGTTEAALRALELARVGDAIVAAIRAADARAAELGDQFGRDD